MHVFIWLYQVLVSSTGLLVAVDSLGEEPGHGSCGVGIQLHSGMWDLSSPTRDLRPLRRRVDHQGSAGKCFLRGLSQSNGFTSRGLSLVLQ